MRDGAVGIQPALHPLPNLTPGTARLSMWSPACTLASMQQYSSLQLGSSLKTLRSCS